MKKGYIILSLAAALTAGICLNAYAETVTIDDVSSTASGTILSGHTESAVSRPLTAQVIVPGGTFGELEDVYRADIIKTDDKGSFTYTVSPDDTDLGGIYTVYIGGRDIDEIVSQTFTFISFKNREEAIAKIKAFQTVSEFEAFISDEYSAEVMKSLGFDYEKYNAFSDSEKDMYCEIMLNSELSVDNFTKQSNSAAALVDINTASENDRVKVFRENASALGIDLGENTVSDWLGTEKTDDVINAVLSGTAYMSSADLAKKFNDSVIVKAFGNARWNEMEKLISLCGEYIGLDTDSSIYKSKKTAVHKYMVEYTYEKIEDVNTNFEKALKKAESDTDGGSSGGTGSSGSSGSSGGSGNGGGSGSSDSGSKKTSGNLPAPVIKETQGNANERRFTDLSDVQWAANSIEKLAAAEIISGDGNGRFIPERTVTREEYVKMLVCAFKTGGGANDISFTDVKQSDWFFYYIKSAVNSDIVRGADDGSFGTGREISREDMAVMAMRALDKAGAVLESKRTAVEFKDKEDISDYASEAVEKLYCAEIINGFEDGSFMPKATATRAQAAVIIAAAMQVNGGEQHD